MVELGQLEKHHEEFARRNTRVVAVSSEDRETAAKSQEQFPHLIILSDPDKALLNAAGLVHNAASTMGKDAAAPTTVLTDRGGQVRWLFRPDRHIARLSPAEVLAAVDQHLGQ